MTSTAHSEVDLVFAMSEHGGDQLKAPHAHPEPPSRMLLGDLDHSQKVRLEERDC